jgi:hypothetical protein
MSFLWWKKKDRPPDLAYLLKPARDSNVPAPVQDAGLAQLASKKHGHGPAHGLLGLNPAPVNIHPPARGERSFTTLHLLA